MSARLHTDDPETWRVAGELTFASVPEIQQDSVAQFDSPPATLDLSGVERIDSAGIALVVEWARRAKAAGASMRLVHVPAGMAALSRTVRLHQLLNIDESA